MPRLRRNKTEIAIPKLVNGRGNYSIELSFGYVGDTKVGLIRVSSGTREEKIYGQIVDMLHTLKELGEADLLIAIKERRQKPLDVLHYYRRQKLQEIPTS